MRATRRFTDRESVHSAAQEEEENEKAKPKFRLGASLSGLNQSTNDAGSAANDETKKPFSFTFTKPLSSSTQFGQGFKSEAKMFANKNLFANPMIKPASKKAKIKTDDSEQAGKPTSQPPLILSKRKSLAGSGGAAD